MFTSKSENEKFALKASLKYVDITKQGFSRTGSQKSFRYLDQKGKPLRSEAYLKRIKGLVIPPAWKNVWICADADGHVQATGFDARGRKQYRYHAEWNQKRNEKKFTKIIEFANSLPKIRSRLKKDIKKKGIGPEKVLASVIRLMEKTLIRVGNTEYAEKNKSYGLTTMHNKHVKVQGAKITFDFKGKSGQIHHIEVFDAELSKIVKQCQELPGQELFAYKDPNGIVKDITSTDVNRYLQEISGQPITAKDFRLWGGTVQAALYLRDKNPPPSKTEIKKVLLDAVRHTSIGLGNTPAVCRKYYIHPGVFACFESGKLNKLFKNSQRKNLPKLPGLLPEEVFTKNLIESFK